MTRRYDPRRALPHMSYTRAQLAETFGVTLATISSWSAKGLQTIDGRRPYLFAGGAVRNFLKQHNKPYQPTGPGEIYCVACKRVIEPADGVVDFILLSRTSGNLCGTCPHCFRKMVQRVRREDIGRKAGHLKVRFENGSVTFPGVAGPAHTARCEEIGS